MDTATFSYFNVAEVELSYRNPVKPSQRAKITRSADCYELLMAHWGTTLELYEDFYVVLLSNANRVLGLVKIGTGGVTGCVVDPKKIYQAAVKANASCLILAHNHPSGNLQPSEADKKITQKVVDAGILLDIKVLDHLIVTSEGYLSFSDAGLM